MSYAYLTSKETVTSKVRVKYYDLIVSYIVEVDLHWETLKSLRYCDVASLPVILK